MQLSSNTKTYDYSMALHPSSTTLQAFSSIQIWQEEFGYRIGRTSLKEGHILK